MKTLYGLIAGAILTLAGLLFGYRQKSNRLSKENERLKKTNEVQSNINEAYIDGELRAEKERAEALQAAADGRRDHFE